MVIATYPGTFDPLTRGHLDLIRRAAKLFPKLIVAFTLEERLEMIQNATAEMSNVEVYGFTGLLATFVREHHSQCIIRGARAVSDFEYEFQMAGMNQILMPEVDTLFLTPAEQYQFVSGSFVREIASMGGDVSGFVTDDVASHLRNKFVAFKQSSD